MERKGITVWKFQNFSAIHILYEINFVRLSQSLARTIFWKLISRKNLKWAENVLNFHTVKMEKKEESMFDVRGFQKTSYAWWKIQF